MNIKGLVKCQNIEKVALKIYLNCMTIKPNFIKQHMTIYQYTVRDNMFQIVITFVDG